MSKVKLLTSNLIAIEEALQEFKDKAKPKIEEIANRTLAEMAVFIYDSYQINAKNGDSALTVARMNILTRQEQIRKTFKSDPQVDFSISITLFPLNKKTTIGILFCHHTEISDILLSSDIIVPATDKEFEKACNSPGYSYQICDSVFPTGKNLDAYFPSFEDRCNHAALDGCFQKYVSSFDDKMITNQTIEKFRVWLDTEEGQISKQAAIDYCKQNLEKDINEESL